MMRSAQVEIDAGMEYGLTVNAFDVMNSPVSDPCAWKISLESCPQAELEQLLTFMKKRDLQGFPGYKIKIKKITSWLSHAIPFIEAQQVEIHE